MMNRLVCAVFFSCFSVLVEGQNIAPMLDAHWHQSKPFNSLCPNKAPAGCGAIAVAQTLHFYQMPLHGYGYYNKNGENLELENLPIDWENILDIYSTGRYSEKQASAAAWLVYLTGLSMNMQYSTEKGSSPKNNGSMIWGMQHYLHISPESRYLYRRNYSTSDWKTMIDNELIAGRPILYRGTFYDSNNNYYGHMFVIDGKSEEGLYHVNFGHANTSQDKYVDLDYINQSAGDAAFPGGKSVCYNHQQAMVINCYPVDGLSEADYEEHPLIIEQAFIVNRDSLCERFETALGKYFHVSYKLRDCSFTGGNCLF